LRSSWVRQAERRDSGRQEVSDRRVWEQEVVGGRFGKGRLAFEMRKKGEVAE
jgi:hypothetical protein